MLHEWAETANVNAHRNRIIGRLAELEPAKYEAVEALRDGRRFKIRALRPADRTELLSRGPD